ncbi:hypothetical protein [Gordonia sp. (in: high G+C Gram-positive bacteria)]|uniref:hypothetical protein n=1 Tax=Gordonia sp. (in: high G+C Gram-positive bacteria) TaxID=84139 RepID=UPI003C769899
MSSSRNVASATGSTTTTAGRAAMKCRWRMPAKALARLLHRDGRRAHRLRVAIAELDERFRAVTVERGTSWRSTNWWRRRELL